MVPIELPAALNVKPPIAPFLPAALLTVRYRPSSVSHVTAAPKRISMCEAKLILWPAAFTTPLKATFSESMLSARPS